MYDNARLDTIEKMAVALFVNVKSFWTYGWWGCRGVYKDKRKDISVQQQGWIGKFAKLQAISIFVNWFIKISKFTYK